MSRVRKLISVLCVSAIGLLPFASLTACKKDNLITLNVYSQLANFDGAQTGFFSTLMADKFGVKLNIMKDNAGTYDTLMEKRNLGDIVVWGDNGDKYSDAIISGMLLDWESLGLLDNYGQNIKNYFGDALEASRENTNKIPNIATSRKNKIYGLGHDIAPVEYSEGHEAFFYNWDIRWDIYMQTSYFRGEKQLKDLDDYLDLLIEMKTICPKDDNGKDTYAVSMWKDWDGDMVMYVKSTVSAYYGYDELALGLYNTDDWMYHDALQVYGDGSYGPYLEMLQFYNKLNQAGLVDPASLTQTYDDAVAKVRNGGVFTSLFNYSGNLAYNTDDHLAEGKMMASLVPEEAKVISYAMNPNGSNRIWSIGAKSAYPDLCMQIIDWLCTPEGAMSMWYGLQGIHWDYNQDGTTSFTEFGRACYKDDKIMQTSQTWVSPYTGKSYKLKGNFNDGKLQINNTTWSINAINPDSAAGEKFSQEFWASEQVPSELEIVRSWEEYTGYYNRQDYLENRSSGSNDRPYSVIPATNYKQSKRGTLSSDWSQCTASLRDNSWRAIMAKSDKDFTDIVNAMISECNGFNYASCLEWSLGEAQLKFGSLIPA